MKKVLLILLLSLSSLSGLQARNVFVYFYDVMFKYQPPGASDKKEPSSKYFAESIDSLCYKHFMRLFPHAFGKFFVGSIDADELSENIDFAFSESRLETVLDEDKKECKKTAKSLWLEKNNFWDNVKPDNFMVQVLQAIKAADKNVHFFLLVKAQDFFKSSHFAAIQKKYGKELSLFDYVFDESPKKAAPSVMEPEAADLEGKVLEVVTSYGLTLSDDDDVTIVPASYECPIIMGNGVKVSATAEFLSKLCGLKFLDELALVCLQTQGTIQDDELDEPDLDKPDTAKLKGKKGATSSRDFTGVAGDGSFSGAAGGGEHDSKCIIC